ncbi:MAG: hypothetical protein SVW77_03725 [Candidatus Nanohaloarchaea archaeon]|nr:hypothetical protein [Candidatus Nanohaloarchaea archaeon]
MEDSTLRDRATVWLRRVGNDPDAVFAAVKQGTGVVIGLAVASVSLALATVYVRQSAAAPLFASLALFWSGYLFAHYAASGKIIHQTGEGTKLPDSRRSAVLAVAGVLLLLAGVTAAPLPAARGDIPLTSFTVLIAAFGYVMAHYGFTGHTL